MTLTHREHTIFPNHNNTILQGIDMSRPRHTRNNWLVLALDVLAEEGRAKIEIGYIKVDP